MPTDESQESKSLSLGVIVLAGGRSSRMGSEKSLLQLGGHNFLQRIVLSVAPHCLKVVIVSNQSQQPSLPEISQSIEQIRKLVDVPVEHEFDEFADKGPLEGMRVGLKSLESTCDLAFVTSCDVPLLRPEIIRFLASRLGKGKAVVPIDQNGRLYGMTAVYRTLLHGEIMNLIHENKLRVSYLAEYFNATRLDVNELKALDPDLDSITNVNFVEDYEALRSRMGER